MILISKKPVVFLWRFIIYSILLLFLSLYLFTFVKSRLETEAIEAVKLKEPTLWPFIYGVEGEGAWLSSNKNNYLKEQAQLIIGNHINHKSISWTINIQRTIRDKKLSLEFFIRGNFQRHSTLHTILVVGMKAPKVMYQEMLIEKPKI